MAQVHIDIDNLWIYEREYGSKSSLAPEYIFEQALPLMLELFSTHGVKATFFLVAKDLQFQACRDFCSLAIERGHEIANHTYTHPSNLHRLSKSEKEFEIMKAHDLISAVTNRAVTGFRAPGYYLDRDIIEILVANGYQYDSSVLPSPINCLMSFYVSWKSGRALDKAFGRKRYALASRKISRIQSKINREKFLLELPIHTLPLLRFPTHSTMIYLLGSWYCDLVSYVLRNSNPNSIYLFHAIDMVDCLPGDSLASKVLPLQIPLARRIEIANQILKSIQSQTCQTAASLVSNLNPQTISKARLLALPMPSKRLA